MAVLPKGGLGRDLTPAWMMETLSEQEREMVMDWLKKHGVNPEECAYVTVNVMGQFVAKMYAMDASGRAEIRDGEALYAEDIVFTAHTMPDVVVQRIAGNAQK